MNFDVISFVAGTVIGGGVVYGALRSSFNRALREFNFERIVDSDIIGTLRRRFHEAENLIEGLTQELAAKAGLLK